MSARRAEIEAKRAKLAELRRAREERARRAQEPAEEARPPSAPVREDLDALTLEEFRARWEPADPEDA